LTNLTFVPTNLNVPVYDRLSGVTYTGWFTAFRVVAAPRMVFEIPFGASAYDTDTVFVVVKNLSSRLPPRVGYLPRGWRV